MTIWKRTLLFLLALSSSPAFSQTSFQSPEEILSGDKPVAVIFNGFTKQSEIGPVLTAIDDARTVRPFHLVRANRGFLMYEGFYFGDKNYLLTRLAETVRGKLQMKTADLEADGLEITFTPLGM